MSEEKKLEVKKSELTKEELQNIIVVLGSFKGFTIQEGVYFNNLVGKLQEMMK